MSKVIALMSMSLDGFVADPDDGVDEVFDWYFAGDVGVPTPSTTSDFTFRVSAPSADHLRNLMAEVGAMLTGRRMFERADGWGGRHPWEVPAFDVTHRVPDGWPRADSTVHLVTTASKAPSRGQRRLPARGRSGSTALGRSSSS